MHAKPLQRSKRPRTWIRRFRFLLILFHSLWHRYLKFILSCLSAHVALENFAKLAALCLIQDQVHLLWKKNKWIKYIQYFIAFIFFIDSKVKRNYALYTLYELHYSATTSWNMYCSEPMHLLGLGNKFGVRIINTIKTPDKEHTFSFIKGN